MLSVATIGSNLNYYLELASVEYYLKGGEPPGLWFGRGAESLGLEGTAEKKEVANLAKGLSPNGKKKLIQLQKKAKSIRPVGI
ncbi:MAG TPA: relaxase domain-containing protein [Planctomycetaceae bacterium]|mgnify:CR=1 FL=1|nr:relaxase domain-containing protein [Planctomycetaceae bacterium]